MQLFEGLDRQVQTRAVWVPATRSAKQLTTLDDVAPVMAARIRNGEYNLAVAGQRSQ